MTARTLPRGSIQRALRYRPAQPALPLARHVRLLPARLDLDDYELLSLPAAPQARRHSRRVAGSPTAELPEPLSERERDVLRGLAEGHSNRELAALLQITPGTVRWHLGNIYGKLGVRRRTQAVARARELGLLPP